MSFVSQRRLEMRPRICVPIAKESAKEIARIIGAMDMSTIDLVEVRADYLKDWSEIEEIPRISTVPTILTYKVEEKRALRQDIRSIRSALAAAGKFAYFDLDLASDELKEIVSQLRTKGVKPIVSYHYTSGTPPLSTLRGIIKKEAEAGAEICKLVTTAKKPEDNLTCLRLVSEMSKAHELVCFAMGPLGTPSRLISPLIGANFTFASLEMGAETAPGQLTVDEMRRIYHTMGVQNW